MYPVALLKNHFLTLLTFFLSIFGSVFGQSAKDGAETISTTGVIFNRYAALASSASAGATTITVDNIANLSASAIVGTDNNPYATDALGYGDLLMIIKMQGASINTTNSSSYGSISAYNNTGVYELSMVQSVAGNVITLSSVLNNPFTIGGTQRVQVVRVPRLSSLTINSGATLTGQAWSSNRKGGIVAIEVAGNAVINGSITANGIGFKGGQLKHNPEYTGINTFVSTIINNGAQKGESIAGDSTDYDALGGRYARGAPANGGGGGNFHNAGGGGGANAGNSALWTGYGTPDTSVAAWKPAWNLDTARPSFWTSSSSGGGRGGYSYSARDRVATTIAPDDSFWGGDSRRNIGGLGGRPLTYLGNTLFLGGGGGAGDHNQSAGGAGANGGGIVYLTITGSLSGSGSITANGGNATNTIYPHTDAAGGGGGGGAISLNVQGAISGISLYANGGNGGSQQFGSPDTEAEGPGGGGGPGYIGVTGSPTINMYALGGANGTTNSSGLTEFLPNGATSGGTGSAVTGLSFQAAPDIPLPVRLECFDMISMGEEKVLVNWIAYDEVDVLKYELEQREGYGEWKTIYTEYAQSAGDIIKRYSITINRSLANAYYRLKSVDKDGSLNYTCTKSLRAAASKSIMVAQSNGRLYINHPGKSCHFTLQNSFGQVMPVKIFPTSSSSTIIEKSYLPKGIYYLRIIAGDEMLVYDFAEN